MGECVKWVLIAAIVCVAAFPWNVGPGNPLADSAYDFYFTKLSIDSTAVGIVSITE